jgi:hypothetical protein
MDKSIELDSGLQYKDNFIADKSLNNSFYPVSVGPYSF